MSSFDEVLDQVRELLQRKGRLAYPMKLEFLSRHIRMSVMQIRAHSSIRLKSSAFRGAVRNGL